MIIVHHLNNSRSQRVLWLLEELGLEYQIKFYERDPNTMLAPPSLMQVHPLGKSPVITDGDLTIAESGAIVDYLVTRYGNGQLMPTRESGDYLRYNYWLHYAEGSAMSPLLMKLVFDKIERSPMPFFVKPIALGIVQKVKTSFISPQITRHLDYLEAEVSKTGWFVGEDFSAADIQMSFPLEAAASRGGLNGSRPNLMAWLAKIHSRQAYVAALKKGGKYDLLT
ncbi:glutathione S-transferase [Undibacterium sp. RuTC16W]|uniref:glutathione S-transferase n=1 Tax=Undibacterium sp. RuTC16W TaxID=3413048 RepID=UPI003BEF6941